MMNSQASVQVPNWAANWEARTKIVAAIIYIFGVISLTQISFTAVAYLSSLLVLLVMRISIKLLLQRYLIITPFLLLMTIPMLWQPETSNAIFVGLIITKAFTSMTVITIVLESQSLDQLINGLAGLHIPPKLLTILILSYRYVFMFLDDIQRMLTAAKSRFFRGSIRISKLRVYGQLMAGLLVKAIERSENMYKAMASRGFEGAIPFTPSNKITSKDIIKTGISITIICSIIILENIN
ncbi:energy-coupling factor transporter transmembrane component T family protein [Gracilibacillus lacisalsi]|uniref:energy-coupling factor transporter transmembrane component T family protein n=1 Tax=Gracilibacillus lacisalsi TaxID=393087 RepID=UPI000381A6C9|nr:energy-coupling factor transporter transmembrane component T [Gracilibacillus lacisalsi]